MKFFLPTTLGAVLGCGLMAGLFFIFSVCIMRALGQLPAEKGIAAMQSINVVILNPLFLSVFMGTALLCVYSLVVALMNWNAPAARYLLAGSLCYLIGVILVTGMFNVPLNDALAAVKPQSEEGARLWANYLTTWTLWNHVRTVASILATALFALALAQNPQP